MKTTYLPLACLLCMNGFISCDTNDSEAIKGEQTNTIPNTRSISSIASPNIPSSAVYNTSAVATGLNPAHGLPNHRCDIAVGAPLNSASTKTTGLQNQSTVQSPSIIGNSSTTVNPTTNSTVVAAGMNPPHGQPNHRCDIAVGAPLNSAPTNAAALQTKIPPQITTPTSSQISAPVIANNAGNPATVSNVKVAPGMNPPHGQPNHRCDIAVGAPLNSAPTNKVAPAVTSTAAPIIPPLQPLPNNNNSSVKLNPAHGQHGHDCAIPVGQPLKQ